MTVTAADTINATAKEWRGGPGVFYVAAISTGVAMLETSPDAGANWFDVPSTVLTAKGSRSFSVPNQPIRLKSGSTGVTAFVNDNPDDSGLNDTTGGGSAASTALPAGTDRSGTITTGGTAQQMAPANASRQSLTGQNISDIDLWINEIGGAAAANTAGSFKIPAGSAFSIATNRAISVVGATTGKAWTATET
jgi:hypothetical protein